MWIGIDIAIHAVKRVARIRLRDKLGLKDGTDFMIEGVPRNVEGARDLWQRDPYHFQKWAVEQVDGFVNPKRTGDGGIDGRIYFIPLDNPKHYENMIIEVKGGKNLSIDVLRKLQWALDNNDAKMAGLIMLEPISPTKERNFKQLTASAGHYDDSGTAYPRLQILSVSEILEGKRFKSPPPRGKWEQSPQLPLDSFKGSDL